MRNGRRLKYWLLSLTLLAVSPGSLIADSVGCTESSDCAPVVIAVWNMKNLGYFSYAEAMSHIIREAYPNQKIQIIAEVQNKMSDFDHFSFPEGIETIVFCPNQYMWSLVFGVKKIWPKHGLVKRPT